ncbi:MAG: hypothetical protein JW768_04785, partial [Chitinispirillaceae bacterium]|nr:hypothetical protein [Chitinispirillaceae bacterium]
RKGQIPAGTRIDRHLLETAIPASTRQKVVIWFCGPEALRSAVQHHLGAMGISPKHLIYEKFSL